MNKEPEDTISDIHRLMERSSRFHSLNGFSLVAAGICGLLGVAWVRILTTGPFQVDYGKRIGDRLRDDLIVAGLCILAAAIISALFFTWLKARKKGLPLWSVVFRKVTASFLIPLVTGGALVVGMIFRQEYHFIATSCLLFYGLSLVNAAHYTLKEIRFLGMFEIIVGIFCLFSEYRLLSLAIGFGLLNILYGLIIWYKYKESALVK